MVPSPPLIILLLILATLTSEVLEVVTLDRNEYEDICERLVPRGVPVPGGAATDRVAPAMVGIQEVGVYLGGGSNSGGWVWDNGDVHPSKVEYSCAVHFYLIAPGRWLGVGEKSVGMGGDAVVWTDGYWFVREKGYGGNGGGGGHG